MSLMNMHAVPEISALKPAVAAPSHLALCFSFSCRRLSLSHSLRQIPLSPTSSREGTLWMIFIKNIQCGDEGLCDIVRMSGDRIKVAVCARASEQLKKLIWQFVSALEHCSSYTVLCLGPLQNCTCFHHFEILLTCVNQSIMYCTVCSYVQCICEKGFVESDAHGS